MSETEFTQTPRNPWKATAIGMAVVAVIALVTGIVVANRTRSDDKSAVQAPSLQPESRGTAASATAPTPPRAASQARTSSVPDAGTVKACNEHAAAASGPRDKTGELVKDGAVGALVGAAVGAAGGAIADGGKGAGKGAAIGGVLGAGAGTLYGINDNRKHDSAYREAYAGCLRSRGYIAVVGN